MTDRRISDIAEIERLKQLIDELRAEKTQIVADYESDCAQLKQAVESATSLAAKATERVAELEREAEQVEWPWNYG